MNNLTLSGTPITERGTRRKFGQYNGQWLYCDNLQPVVFCGKCGDTVTECDLFGCNPLGMIIAAAEKARDDYGMEIQPDVVLEMAEELRRKNVINN